MSVSICFPEVIDTVIGGEESSNEIREIFIVRGLAEQCFYACPQKGHFLLKHTEMSSQPLGRQGQERQEIMKESVCVCGGVNKDTAWS